MLAILWGGAGLASAQEAGTGSPATSDAPPRILTSLSGRAEWTFDTDLDGDEAERVHVARAGGVLGVRMRATERSSVTVSLDYEMSDYGFDFAAGLGDKEFFDPLHSGGMGLMYQAAVDDRWAWFVRGSVNYAGEPGSDFGDSLTYGLFGGAMYGLNESTRVGFGTGFNTRLAKSTFFFPFPTLDWRINERWQLEIGTNGPGGTLTYQATEQLAAWLSADWQTRAWRLDADGADAPEGVFRDEGVQVMLGAKWTPNRQLSMEAGAGMVFMREFTMFDRDDNELWKDDVDAAPVVRLGVGYRF